MQTAYLDVDGIKIENGGQQTFSYPQSLVGFRRVLPFPCPLTAYDSKANSSPRRVVERYDKVKAC